MAEKSLFFNALPDEKQITGYDRNYNADDISDWLSSAFETGVIKTDSVNNEPQGLKIIAKSGRQIEVNAGKAAIKGKAYINNAIKPFTLSIAPTGSNPRYDYVILRFDNEPTYAGRKITLELVEGTSTKPTLSRLTRTATIYDLLIGYIEVRPNVEVITQADITDTRGDAQLCPWFTAVKGYENYYDAITQRHESVITLEATKQYIVTTIPSNLYNSRYSLVSVYTNGIKENESEYTITLLSTGFLRVNFNTAKQSGSIITVVVDNFLDGEGMSQAIQDYTNWKAAVARLETAGEYDYICNGTDDNVQISNLVKSWLNGGNDYGSVKINIIGQIGMTAPARGDGTTSNPYGWFDFISNNKNRCIVLDFTQSSQIEPAIVGGKYNVIFYTDNVSIKGANVVVSNTTEGTIARIFNLTTGKIKAENCRFYITGYKDSLISHNGIFTNCRGSIANVINNSYCFLPASDGVVQINGGEYYAYTGDSASSSAIVGQSGANAVSILYGVSAPTIERTGFYQTNSLIQFVGGGIMSCTDLISELPLAVTAGISNIRGTIAKSKPGLI